MSSSDKMIHKDGLRKTKRLRLAVRIAGTNFQTDIWKEQNSRGLALLFVVKVLCEIRESKSSRLIFEVCGFSYTYDEIQSLIAGLGIQLDLRQYNGERVLSCMK